MLSIAKKVVLVNSSIIAIILIGFSLVFYPKQIMPVGEIVELTTPNVDIFHNDCVHPCIRMMTDSTFVLVQTPYYARNSRIEIPIIYKSNTITSWNDGVELVEAPCYGYYSDPAIYCEGDNCYCLYRECGTPECERELSDRVVSMIKLNYILEHNGGQEKKPIIKNTYQLGDIVQCPILLNKKGQYYIYAVWYQYSPRRNNIGISIWNSPSIESPDFSLVDTIAIHHPLVCDKLAQFKMNDRLFFIPWAKRYDLWHFDLFEYEGSLYMVSCAENDDNIMLSKSDDWKHFSTFRKPLINAHSSETKVGYRQYYYKPTALIKNDSLYLFYTANDKNTFAHNQLFVSSESLDALSHYFER